MNEFYLYKEQCCSAMTSPQHQCTLKIKLSAATNRHEVSRVFKALFIVGWVISLFYAKFVLFFCLFSPFLYQYITSGCSNIFSRLKIFFLDISVLEWVKSRLMKTHFKLINFIRVCACLPFESWEDPKCWWCFGHFVGCCCHYWNSEVMCMFTIGKMYQSYWRDCEEKKLLQKCKKQF